MGRLWFACKESTQSLSKSKTFSKRSEIIYHRFKRFQKRHQLPASDVRLHEMRHTAATFMLVAGHGAGQVAKRLGHSSARVTQSLYEHLHQGEQTAMGGLYDRLTGYEKQEEGGDTEPPS